MGLSTAHISPEGEITKFGKAQYWVGGGLIKVSKPKTQNIQKGGGARGKIKGFTMNARRRLMRLTAQTKKAISPIFVTLTYPSEYPDNSREWKRDLDNLFKRLIRMNPKISCIWKLEPQKRGAPHFHLLVWGSTYAGLILNISRIWYEVVGSGDIKHLRAGTRVEHARSWKGVISYASKYLAKIEDLPQGWNNPGRFWGVMNRKCIPWADLVSVDVTYKQAVKLIRLMRRACHIKSRDYQSLTGFLDGEFWLERLDGCI